MRLFYALLLVTLSSGLMFSQTSNWDFETWEANFGYDDLTDWENINQYAAILGVSPSVEKVTSGAPQGDYAAKLITYPCSNCVAVIGPGSDTLPGLITQSEAHSVVPQTATFMYKYNGVAGDMGLFYAELTSWDTVGDSAIVVALAGDSLMSTSNWTSRTVQFYPGPGASLTPDSITVSFVSSAGALDVGTVRPQIGSELSIDALSLNTQVSVEENIKEEFQVEVISGNLNVVFEMNTQAKVELIDLTGKTLGQKRGEDFITFDVSNYSQGIYLVRFSSDKGVSTKKVFIE